MASTVALHHAVPMLRASKAANIICISSVAGRLGIPWRTPYVATKWAIVGIAKSLAEELGPDNIRVNAILPGIVEGSRIDGVISARAKLEGIEETAMAARSRVPMKTTPGCGSRTATFARPSRLPATTGS